MSSIELYDLTLFFRQISFKGRYSIVKFPIFTLFPKPHFSLFSKSYLSNFFLGKLLKTTAEKSFKIG